MGKTKKFEMNVVDEGYDDKTWQELELEKEKLRQKMKQEEEKGFNFVNGKNIVIMIIWAIIYRLFIKWGFGTV
jgi:hypothetical protein